MPTENFGLRNNLSNCRLLKCISSGNSHSSRRFLASPFFDDLREPFDEEARDKEEAGAEANRVLED